ncbi:MAG: HypC/HybG/HupF family hydrogenase formation chaperone [Syntrophomonadaceae bacterium]|jgi:hydrogenase expression/formation protein HypC|nr:HypC/HybG/HupF family hydrogenase formation chaperone [Syntrophomonadaceae bacterium]
MCIGVPGRIIELQENYRAIVDVNGNRMEISVRLTPEVEPGQYVLIHAGFAMEIIDEDAARETMQILLEVISYGQL